MRYKSMKLLMLLAVLLPITGPCQHLDQFIQLKEGGLPEKILSGRSFVLVSPEFTEKEIVDIHASFVKTGIDAIGYCEVDKVFAGTDVDRAYWRYLESREVTNLIILLKKKSAFEIIVTPFAGSNNEADRFVHEDAVAWKTQHALLAEALLVLYRTALNQYKRQNLLINEVPETDLPVQVITGDRREQFAYDLKVDGLAVQKFGEATLDRELEEIMKTYPFKYQLVDKSIPEAELRKQGCFYLLRYVYTRGPVAKQLLGYGINKNESALVSVTYSNGLEQIKTIAGDVPVYKFYVRQIEYNNVFVGPKWDADTTWQQALRNFIKGLRNEMKVN